MRPSVALYILALLAAPRGAGAQPVQYPDQGWIRPANADFDRARAIDLVRRGALHGLLDGRPENEWAVDVEAFVEAAIKLDGYSGSPHAVAVYRLTAKVATDPSQSAPSWTYLLLLKLPGFPGQPPLKLAESLLAASSGGRSAHIYSLQLVASQFEKNPLVLLMRDEGGNSRSYRYELYRFEWQELHRVWSYSGDGETPSTAACYRLSNLDFSSLSSGTSNRIVTYTTKGCRREWEGVTKADLIPRRGKRVFVWRRQDRRFVEVGAPPRPR